MNNGHKSIIDLTDKCDLFIVLYYIMLPDILLIADKLNRIVPIHAVITDNRNFTVENSTKII